MVRRKVWFVQLERAEQPKQKKIVKVWFVQLERADQPKQKKIVTFGNFFEKNMGSKIKKFLANFSTVEFQTVRCSMSMKRVTHFTCMTSQCDNTSPGPGKSGFLQPLPLEKLKKISKIRVCQGSLIVTGFSVFYKIHYFPTGTGPGGKRWPGLPLSQKDRKKSFSGSQQVWSPGFAF